MLVELVRKREKLKREQIRFLHMINDLQLRPMCVVMKRVLDRLSRKDPADIFADPVSIDEVRAAVFRVCMAQAVRGVIVWGCVMGEIMDCGCVWSVGTSGPECGG